MDAKQRRTKARHDRVFQVLEEAKSTIVVLSRDLLAAREQLQPALTENEKVTKALKECRSTLADSEAVAREATSNVRDLRQRLGAVDTENTVLKARLTAEVQQAKDASAKEIAKLRRRLANRGVSAETALLNRKAVTVQPL